LFLDIVSEAAPLLAINVHVVPAEVSVLMVFCEMFCAALEVAAISYN
jgi:hypothetical protein